MTLTRTSALSAGALVLALTGLALGPLPAQAALPGSSNDGVRIMPLGDSITFGALGGYRTTLWDELTADGHVVDFVGTSTSPDMPAGYPDADNEGHPGEEIDFIDAHIGHWLFASDPRTVLLQIGTNDILHHSGPTVAADAAADLARLIDHILAYKPGVQLFVAQIPPLADPARESVVQAYNASIPGLVAARGSNVHVVNIHDALNTTTDMYVDGIHHSAQGYAKMGAVWAAALEAHPASLQPLAPAPAAPVGSTISLRASDGDYVSAWQSHGHLLEAISPHVAAWEKFIVADAGHGFVGLWSVGSSAWVQAAATSPGGLTATSPTLTPSSMFRWISVAPGQVVLVAAANSYFVGMSAYPGVDPIVSTALLATPTEVLQWQLAP
jgi:lysophospholipase L1-like esterase